MGKIKVSEKSLVESFGKERIFWVGYCNGQNALSRSNPVYYNAGIYGWNFDGYVIDNALIITGYRTQRNFKKLVGLCGIEYAPDYIYQNLDNRHVCPWYKLEKEDLDSLLTTVINWNFTRNSNVDYIKELYNRLAIQFGEICKKRGLCFDRERYLHNFVE